MRIVIILRIPYRARHTDTIDSEFRRAKVQSATVQNPVRRFSSRGWKPTLSDCRQVRHVGQFESLLCNNIARCEDNILCERIINNIARCEDLFCVGDCGTVTLVMTSANPLWRNHPMLRLQMDFKKTSRTRPHDNIASSSARERQEPASEVQKA